MKNDSISNPTQNGLPSDEQVDSVLRDFFRLEVPAELSQPLRRNSLPNATIAASMKGFENRTEQLQFRAVRSVAVAASVAAMALGVLVVISGNKSSPVNGGTAANGTIHAPATTPDIDKPMLVSPQGDSRTSGQSISPDGVTLEETDSIKFHR